MSSANNENNDDVAARGIPQVGRRKRGNRWPILVAVCVIVVLVVSLGAKTAMDRLRDRAADRKEPKAARGLPNLARSAFDSERLPQPVDDKPATAATTARLAVDDLLERRKRAPVLAFGGTGPSADAALGSDDALGATSDRGGSLGGKLQATRMAGARAYQLTDPAMTLTQGSFLDCTLITAINSTLPGMTSCVLSRNVYSTNGHVLLLERGSKLVGQYQSGQLRQGMRRIFVLWTRAETPTGVLVDLDSPSTDSLGRSGMDGTINNHFWLRFGSAMLVSVVDDVVQGALQAQQQSNQGDTGITYNNTSQATQSAAAVIVQNTVNIPPTLDKAQGSRIGIFVARDLYFGNVYKLEPRNRP
jgi:type IV secretion system protein VirB10